MRFLSLMSGSSLDGCDMGIIEINDDGEKLDYQIIRAQTIPYSSIWRNKLQEIVKESTYELAKIEYSYSKYIGELINSFLSSEDFIDYIAFHGHTIFHEPENGFTCQIGNGGALAAATGFPVICDFRSKDIAFGGEGTPLAAIVDFYFFKKYNAVLNLGGICNITLQQEKKVLAWDISPCNQILNHIARKMGLEYDENGTLAEQGDNNAEYMKVLELNPYYSKSFPKSLDNQMIQTEIIPLLDRLDVKLVDQLHTTCIFVANQIYQAINRAVHQEKMDWPQQILLTGGSAHNKFLIQEIQKACAPAVCIVPNDDLIDYKEIVLMALCAYLRIHRQNNILGQVTGSDIDHIGGAIYV